LRQGPVRGSQASRTGSQGRVGGARHGPRAPRQQPAVSAHRRLRKRAPARSRARRSK
jgi:hypothetical protein